MTAFTAPVPNTSNQPPQSGPAPTVSSYFAAVRQVFGFIGKTHVDTDAYDSPKAKIPKKQGLASNGIDKDCVRVSLQASHIGAVCFILP